MSLAGKGRLLQLAGGQGEDPHPNPLPVGEEVSQESDGYLAVIHAKVNHLGADSQGVNQRKLIGDNSLVTVNWAQRGTLK